MGNLPVGFDVAGTGNGLWCTAPVLDPTVVAGTGNMAMVGLGTRFTIERVDFGNSLPKVRAPVLDPTCEGQEFN